MTHDLSRRSFLASLAGGTLAAPFVSSLAGVHAAFAATTRDIRVAMTTATVPMPFNVADQGGEGMRFIGTTVYDALVSWDLTKAESAAVLRPCLATSFRQNPDNPHRWEFTLREGVTFHDGSPFTADDVIFSFDCGYKQDAEHYNTRVAGQIGAQIPDVAAWGSDAPMTFWLETKVVNGAMPYSLTWMGIASRKGWEDAGKDWDSYLNRPVGTGPWKVQSYNQRERAVLLRNEAYWDTPRVPKAERLILMPIPDPNTRVAALRAGQVNFVEAPALDALPMLESTGYQVVKNVYPHNWNWFLSQAEGSPWRDLRVRKAANLAIDREGMREMLGGMMAPSGGFVPEGHNWRGAPAFKLEYNPEEARRLLAEAGFTPEKPLVTKVAISSSGSGQMQPLVMNEYIQQALAEVGIRVELEVFEWQAMLDAWRAGALDEKSRGCTALNISQGTQDPFKAFSRILRSDQIAPKGVNWSGINIPELDELLFASLKESDLGKQDALLCKAHEYIVDNALFLYVAHDMNPRALAPELKGFVQAQAWPQDLTPVEVG